MNKNDVKIILDAGHGGDDSGATGNGIIEKDLNLAITLYMYDRLRELGIPVKITRTTDETLTPTERVNRVMSAWGSDPNVILISNHINASENQTADGAERTSEGKSAETTRAETADRTDKTAEGTARQRTEDETEQTAERAERRVSSGTVQTEREQRTD